MNHNLYSINELLLKNFSRQLSIEGFSKATIKNYITDVNQFLNWKEDNRIFDNFEAVANYQIFLIKKFSSSSVKRKLSSVKKFILFEDEQFKESSEDIKQKFTFAPIAFLALSIVALPFLFKSSQSIETDEISKDVPLHTIISTSQAGQVYSIENSKGIKVVLTNETLNEASLNENINYASFQDEKVSTISINGTATINKGSKDTIIVNEMIKPTSFIQLTPTSKTNNQILYISEQNDGYMIVSVEREPAEDITFQWKIDNTEIYNSIL